MYCFHVLERNLSFKLVPANPNGAADVHSGTCFTRFLCVDLECKKILHDCVDAGISGTVSALNLTRDQNIREKRKEKKKKEEIHGTGMNFTLWLDRFQSVRGDTV